MSTPVSFFCILAISCQSSPLAKPNWKPAATELTDALGWPKSSFGFFYNILPSIYMGWYRAEASQVALVVNNLPPTAGDFKRVWSLGREDPLEKEMAPHSSILAWRIPWTEEPGGLWSIASLSQTRLKRLSTQAPRRVENTSRAANHGRKCSTGSRYCFLITA